MSGLSGDFSDYPPAAEWWLAGGTKNTLTWVHVATDVLVWLALLTISAALIHSIRSGRHRLSPRSMLLFLAFLLAFGAAHLTDALLLHYPVFLAGALVKGTAAIVAWVAVVSLLRCLPGALSQRTPRQREEETLPRTNDLARTRTEAELAGERELLRAVLDNIEESIVACDAEGQLTFANRAAASLFEADEAAMRARDWIRGPRFQEADDSERPALELASPLLRALGGEPFHHFEFVVVAQSGARRSVFGSGQPLHDAAGRIAGAVLAMVDVTERRRLEEQFRQAQKMEALGRLAGGVAHDFNNLLTVINGYGDLLLGNLAPDDPTRHVVAQITRAGDRAAGLTRHLLAFSRQTVLAPRVLDLNEVLAEMIRMLERVIGEDVQLVTSFQPSLGRIRADQGQIEQAVMNLAVNARDAMPQGGLLSIETSDVVVRPNDPLAPRDAAPGRYVLLKVGDTGVGMSEEVKARLFEPFFTTKEKGKGTGLGLAMVYGGIRQIGGHVGVASAPQRGSVFSLYLPRIEDEARPASVKPLRPAVRRGGETILVVEDEAGVRDLVQRILAMNGFRVVAAADGDEAVMLLREAAELDLHLLLTDVVMPGGGGALVARRIGAIRPDVKILYMSGYTDDAALRQGVVSESVHFLQKPFLPAVLVQKVREALDEGR